MYTIFTMLAFISLIALIGGLIRPFKFIPFSSTKNPHKIIGLIFGGIFFVCFALMVITVPPNPKSKSLEKIDQYTSQESVTNTQPTIVINTPTTVETQYSISYNDDSGDVQNILALISPANDSEELAKSISVNIEKNVCTKKCNIDLFDDLNALEIQHQYDKDSATFTPDEDAAWARKNYKYVADHFVGFHEFETLNDFSYYFLKHDSEYQKYNN